MSSLVSTTTWCAHNACVNHYYVRALIGRTHGVLTALGAGTRIVPKARTTQTREHDMAEITKLAQYTSRQRGADSAIVVKVERNLITYVPMTFGYVGSARTATVGTFHGLYHVA